MKKIFIILSLTTLLFSSSVKPINNTVFVKNGKKINLKGKKFIVVSLDGRGGNNLFFAVKANGKTDFFGEVSSGGINHKTPEGIFTVFQKKRNHMSTKYDSGTGINNMDYMLKITKDGIALHAGNVNETSKGCIHVNYIDAPELYNWAHNGIKVVVTRNNYMKHSR